MLYILPLLSSYFVTLRLENILVYTEQEQIVKCCICFVIIGFLEIRFSTRFNSKFTRVISQSIFILDCGFSRSLMLNRAIAEATGIDAALANIVPSGILWQSLCSL